MDYILNDIKVQYDLNINNIFHKIEDELKRIQKRNDNIIFINNHLKKQKLVTINHLQIINFNIGGTFVDINRNILNNSSIPFNLFSNIFSERWIIYFLKDRNNRLFFNFDIKWIDPIFDYFRMKSLNEKFTSLLNIKEQYNDGFHKVVKIFHLEELLLNHITPIYSSISNNKNSINIINSNNLNNEFVKNNLLVNIARLLNISSNIKLDFQKIYSGEKDGFSSINFHSKCDNISNTICYIKDNFGNIFGCFNPNPYSSSNCIVPTNKSFLFSILKDIPIIYPLCKGKYGVNINSSDILFSFGQDLHIANNSNSNFNSCKKNIDKKMFMDNTSNNIINFQVKEIEVYEVVKNGLWYKVNTSLNNIINNKQDIENISNIKISNSFTNAKSSIIDNLFQKGIFSDWLINQLLLHKVVENNPTHNSVGILAEMIYSGKNDGFNSINFHSKCDHISKTVWIIKDDDNNVFGAFTDIPFDRGNSFKSSYKSFLFSLNSRKYYKIKPILYDIKNINHAVYHTNDNLCIFGDIDLFISNNCNSNNLSFHNIGHSYTNNNGGLIQLSSERKFFRVMDIEVFKINVLPILSSQSLQLPLYKKELDKLNKYPIENKKINEINDAIYNQNKKLQNEEIELLSELLFARDIYNGNIIGCRMIKVPNIVSLLDNNYLVNKKQYKTHSELINNIVDLVNKKYQQDEQDYINNDNDYENMITNYNVSGRIVSILTQTLFKFATKLFIEKHNASQDGYIFIEYPKEPFISIITFIRSKSLLGSSYNKIYTKKKDKQNLLNLIEIYKIESYDLINID
jgi:hypothetical protein